MVILGNDYYLSAYLERCGKNIVDHKDIFSLRPDSFVPETFTEAETVSRNWQISDQYVELDTTFAMSGAEADYNFFYSKYTYKDYHYRTDNLFNTKGTQQWQVFSEMLYNNGFFDYMSNEEVLETEQLLIQITSSVDRFHSCTLAATSPARSVSNLIYPDRETIDWNTYKDMGGAEWELLLESSTAALRFFNQNFVASEQQAEFEALIDEFYQYNSSLLESYQSPNERRMQIIMEQNGIVLQGDENSSEAEGDLHCFCFGGFASQEEKTSYVDRLKAYFGQLAAAQGAEIKVLLGQLDSGRRDFLGAEEDESRNMQIEQDIRWERSVKQIRDYWETLSDMYGLKDTNNSSTDEAER